LDGCRGGVAGPLDTQTAAVGAWPVPWARMAAVECKN